MEKKLDVKDLQISFRTVSGKVQAVRGVNFELYKGETLAIVGESGSGKSVTSKAILGILAGNSIIEGGEIIYDGQDLLKIGEDDFYRIRGDKIAMIFQDPLSSLNPIMRIGKQLTEAMLLKGKARQKASRKHFNETLALLKRFMTEANGKGSAAAMDQKCKDFDHFEFKHLELEKAYSTALEAAQESVSDIENALFLIDKKAFTDAKTTVPEIAKTVALTINDYVVSGSDADTVRRLTDALPRNLRSQLHSGDFSETADALRSLQALLKKAIALPQPNFFAMGYYLTFCKEPLPKLPVEELNTFLRRYLDEHFMLEFIDQAEKGVRFAVKYYDERKRTAVTALEAAIPVFEKADLPRAEADKTVASLTRVVEESINPLDISKDSLAYTFGSSLKSAVSNGYAGMVRNKAEEARYAKQMEKYNRLVQRGKQPDWKVVPAGLVDPEQSRADICHVVARLLAHYQELLAAEASHDDRQETIAIIDDLKLSASGVVHKVTKKMAKHKALKLMEEVGISEPRKRYRQYPFEFSGGMRQRIVIAIALAADPDILICDEPTTALDVTIQSQILELINKLKVERQLSIIFITHDLGVVANMADRIAVMYAGKIVEYGTTEDIYYHPAHPYTWALLSSMPDLDTNDKLEAIPGTPPNMIYPPVGDAFAERNKYALKIDFEKQPPMFRISDTHSATTWLLHPNAPKIDVPKVVTDRIARMSKLGGGPHAE